MHERKPELWSVLQAVEKYLQKDVAGESGPLRRSYSNQVSVLKQALGIRYTYSTGFIG